MTEGQGAGAGVDLRGDALEFVEEQHCNIAGHLIIAQCRIILLFESLVFTLRQNDIVGR